MLLVLSRTCYFPNFLGFSFSLFMCMCMCAFYGIMVELIWTSALELLACFPSQASQIHAYIVDLSWI